MIKASDEVQNEPQNNSRRIKKVEKLDSKLENNGEMKRNNPSLGLQEETKEYQFIFIPRLPSRSRVFSSIISNNCFEVEGIPLHIDTYRGVLQ